MYLIITTIWISLNNHDYLDKQVEKKYIYIYIMDIHKYTDIGIVENILEYLQ